MFGTAVAVLVADISGSTALYEAQGNEVAFSLISDCLDKMRAITEVHNGVFIHSKGDDVLCTFEVAQDAFNAAAEMMLITEGTPLSLHSGMDYGEVLWARGDVFGDCVNTTARLAGYAISGEFLCSHAFHAQLPPEHQAKMRFLEKWRFKGKAEGERIYAYAGEGAEHATQFSAADQAWSEPQEEVKTEADTPILKMTFRGVDYICEQGQDFVIGRSVACDLIVPKPWVSRKHAVVEIRRNNAYVRDTSSNGTFICFEGQDPVLARREAVLLPHNCALSLTRNTEENVAEFIHCELIR